MTVSDGIANLIISEISTLFGLNDKTTILYERVFITNKKDFRKTKVGMGTLEHEVILFSMGRITYSELRKKPSSIIGKVEINFRVAPGSEVLKGDTTVGF